MNTDNDKRSAAEKVLDSIREGRVKKLSGRYFTLRTILKIAGAVFASLVLLHLVGFFHATLYRNGLIYAPRFGFHGWLAFFGGLPFFIIALSIIFIVILLMYFRRHRLVYRRPLLYSAAVLVLVTLVAGHLISRTGFHAQLLHHASGVPVLGIFYRHYLAHGAHNMHRGAVIETNESGFVMKNDSDEILTVFFGPETHFPDGNQFETGDEVFVFGKRDGDTVRALGLHKIDK